MFPSCALQVRGRKARVSASPECTPFAYLLQARGRGVPLRVSAISPGIVETEFFAVRTKECASMAQRDSGDA